MNTLKKIVNIIALSLAFGFLIRDIAEAQIVDSTTGYANTTTANDPAKKDSSQYYWVGIVGLIVVGIGIAYSIRKRKRNDTSHLSEDSINNPASGI